MIQHFTVIFPLQVFLRNTICILYGTYSEFSLLVAFSRLIRLKKKREIIGPNINWFFILFFRKANFNELQCCKTELIKKYLLAKNHKNHASSVNY